MKIDFSRVTDENYKEIVEKCQVLIGKPINRYNLPILYIVAMNFKVLDEVYEKIFSSRYSERKEDWIIMTEQELKEHVEKLKNETWPPTFLTIMAIFRDEKNGRVFVDYLEHLL